MRRAISRYTILFLGASCLLCGTAPGGGAVHLVRNGQPLFDIVYAADAMPSGRRVYEWNQPLPPRTLADFLADYVEKSVGKRPDVIGEQGERTRHLAIHCGMTAYARELDLTVADFDSDEFLIAFPDESNVVIAGKHQDGIEYGTYEFLERYFGVRWLFPGELGEHVPTHRDLVIPAHEVHEKPAFAGRSVAHDNTSEATTQWLRIHRLRRRVRCMHNLGVLFPPDTYFDVHPEFYPVLNGVREKPTSLIAWQPCFTAPGIAREAAIRIVEHLKEHPETAQYSLSVNDNWGYCECPTCLEVDGNRTNSLGLQDRSRSYYRFCSEVAALVSAALPGRDVKFGVIAYNNVQEMPDGEAINPHLVPALCTDGMRWLDPGIAARETAILEKWRTAVPELGVYDYIYGAWYALARVYFHHMGDYLSAWHNLGVRHYYAESYPSRNNAEGPKLYVTMKLLWNPNRSVDDILKEWYECAVGPRAAPDVAACFGLLEDFWTQRIPNGEWFNATKKDLCLGYGDLGYLDDIEEADFARMELLLRTALGKTDSNLGRKRLGMWLGELQESKLLVMTRKTYRRLNSPAFDPVAVRVVYSDEFESAEHSWGTWCNEAGRAKLSLDRNAGRGAAPACLLIDKADDRNQPTPPAAVFMRQIPVESGARYRLSVWTKLDGVSANPHPLDDVSLIVRWREKDRQTWVHFTGLEFKTSAGLAREGEWQKLEMIVPVPDVDRIAFATIVLSANVRGGTVRFDDFEMTEVKDREALARWERRAAQIEDQLKQGRLRNLAPNHSFEALSARGGDVSEVLMQAGYSVWPPDIRASVTLQRGEASDGRQCVKFANVPVNGSINRFFENVKPGERYYVALDCRRIGVGRCSLDVGWRDAKAFFPDDSPYNKSFSPGTTKDGNWETIRGIVTVPPQAVTLVFVASVQKSPGDTDMCLFDNFRVCRLTGSQREDH